LDATPLLEEKQDFRAGALCLERCDPIGLHRTGAGTAFTAHDDPVDTAEIDPTKVFQKRFDAQEPHARRCPLEVLDAWEAILFVLDTYSPPNVRRHGSRLKFRSQEMMQALCSLCQEYLFTSLRDL
jgi:hypothetical protein